MLVIKVELVVVEWIFLVLIELFAQSIRLWIWELVEKEEKKSRSIFFIVSRDTM